MRVKPERVRVAVRKGTAPAVGSFVAFKAHLSPPLQPLRPGGYDFARDMYFQRIGASGYVLGAISTLPSPQAPSLRLRYAALLDGLREAINQRIHTILPGDRGSIASALITGKRNAISAPVQDAFYVSSLAHVLAISGFHMAVVAGIAFFVIRALLALSPSLASRRPIKKWAAVGALATGAFYLLLSGTGVSTQRAFIMIAIVLDRRDARPAGADLPHAGGRGLRRAAVYAASGGASELPDVVCGDAGADRGLSIRLALAGRCRHFGGGARGAVGLAARSAAWCWPRWSPGSPPRLTPPTTSTAWRLTAWSPIWWRCRWSRPG